MTTCPHCGRWSGMVVERIRRRRLVREVLNLFVCTDGRCSRNWFTISRGPGVWRAPL